MISSLDHPQAITTSTSTTAAIQPLSADDLVAVAIRCIVTGQDFPEELRAPSAASPGLASVQQRIARLMAGPVGL